VIGTRGTFANGDNPAFWVYIFSLVRLIRLLRLVSLSKVRRSLRSQLCVSCTAQHEDRRARQGHPLGTIVHLRVIMAENDVPM
jgi:hypothetical protein